MSLLEALFLEPPLAPLTDGRPAHEVWIAARNDGVAGSGTQSDPYDGSTLPHPEVCIRALTSSGTLATAETDGNHGFTSDQLVTITGVKRTKLPAHKFDWPFDADIHYLGTFPIRVIDATHFSYCMLGAAASPQGAVPEAGGLLCWREREQFDTVLRRLPAGAAIRLGPGTFETKGYSPNVAGGIANRPGSWHAKAGQHLTGSGIGMTTLKLVQASFAESQWWAVNHPWQEPPHGFEISDLTIDCNLDGQRHRQVACGAIGIAGNHVRIRRLRAIHFGSQTTAYVENFVVVLEAINPATEITETQDSVIEDCIAEQPGANAANNSTLFHLGAGDSANGIHAYHTGFAIRNCHVDGRIVYGTPVPVPIASISYAQPVVTVTTRTPHLLTQPGNAVVNGVTVNGNSNNLFNGVFEVEEVVSATEFTYRLATADTPDAASGLVGGGVSSHPINVTSLTPDDTIEVCPELAVHPFEVYDLPRTYKLTTPAPHPHLRTRNNRIRLYGVQKKNPFPPPAFIPSTAFDGDFAVDEYDPAKPNELLFTLLTDADFDVTKPGELNLAQAFINVSHIALAGGGGKGTIVEGNRVFHCATGGPFHDTYSTGDLTARNNYYQDVISGPVEALGGGISSSLEPISFQSLTHAEGVATATTAFPHGLRRNDYVIISNAYEGQSAVQVQIASVPAANVFLYSQPGSPINPQPSGTGFSTYETFQDVVITHQTRLESFSRIAQTGRFLGQATTALAKHGLNVGDAIRITKCGTFEDGTFLDPNLSPYNGVFRVTSILDERTFEYEFIDAEGHSYDPGLPGAVFSAGYFGRLWQVKRLVIENNVIELAVRWFSGWGNLAGIRLYGNRAFPPEYTVREVIIRDNVIRNLAGGSAPSNFAMLMSGCERLLIQKNIIQSDSPTPLLHANMGTIQTFNNVTPDGNLIRSSVNGNTATKAPEVVAQIRADLEDAMMASFLYL